MGESVGRCILQVLVVVVPKYNEDTILRVRNYIHRSSRQFQKSVGENSAPNHHSLECLRNLTSTFRIGTGTLDMYLQREKCLYHKIRINTGTVLQVSFGTTGSRFVMRFVVRLTENLNGLK